MTLLDSARQAVAKILADMRQNAEDRALRDGLCNAEALTRYADQIEAALVRALPDGDADNELADEAGRMREYFAGKSIHVVQRFNVEQPTTPLLELKFGMVMDGRVLFTTADPDAEPVATPAQATRVGDAWIPVGERLPEPMVTVLVPGYPAPECVFVYIDANGHWRHRSDCSWIPNGVTHWQPLPAPPAATQHPPPWWGSRRIRMAKYSDAQYVAYDPFEGDRDVDIRCREVRVVTTRKPHQCFGAVDGRRAHEIPVGSRARFERAIVEGKWRSYHECTDCMDAWLIECGIIPEQTP